MSEGKSALNVLLQGLNKLPKAPLPPQRQVSAPHSQCPDTWRGNSSPRDPRRGRPLE